MSSLHVSLEQFEGPLALLLYLIRKEEMDIYNIPIHQITKKYLEHIQMMKKLDLEGASDFITMAATLIHIKSKMLLPQYDQEDEPNDDPRKELVQRLVEYQRYQNASKDLLDRPILNRDVWRRGFKEDIVLEENQDIEVDDNGLFGLIGAFRTCVKAAQKRIHKVMKKGQSVASRIMEIRDLLIPGERRIMRELIRDDEMSKNKLLVTFLSMLELAKLGFVRVFQSEPYSDIHVEPLKVIDHDVIQRTESYETQDSDAAAKAAARILAKGEALILQDEALILQGKPSEQLELVAEKKIKEEEEVDTNESATDEDIMSAEKELGFESSEGGSEGEVVACLEPIDDIMKEEIIMSEDVTLGREKLRDGEL